MQDFLGTFFYGFFMQFLLGLASLRAINLEFNRLKEIPSPSISMTHLHLANNNITKIKGRSPWPVMNSLIYIDLDNNNLGDSLDGGM